MTTDHRRPIVAGVGSTETADDVVARAAREALLRGRPLRLVHAYAAPSVPVPPGRSASAAARRAHRSAAERVRAASAYARRLLPDGDVDATVRDGNWVETLLQQASAASMLVVGSGDEWRTDGLGPARVAQLVAHADVPVLVVRGGAERGGRPRTVAPPRGATAGRVVVGCDDGDLSGAVLAAAFEEAELRRTGLLVVSARPDRGDELADRVAEWRRKYPRVSAEHVVSNEAPEAALVEASDGADLLVVGARGSGGFAGLRLGSVADAVVRCAACPVLVVPGRRSSS